MPGAVLIMRRTFGEENTVVCSQKALMSLFLLVPCEEQAGGDEAVQAALAHPARPAADVQRDTNRKPDEVLSFFGIEPGQEVLEVFSGGGYYTQILDALVGPDGKVIAHNNAGEREDDDGTVMVYPHLVVLGFIVIVNAVPLFPFS